MKKELDIILKSILEDAKQGYIKTTLGGIRVGFNTTIENKNVCLGEQKYTLEINNYDLSELKILNKTKNPLEELYQGWMDYDGGVHEPLECSVEETLEFLKEQHEKNKNKSSERKLI